MNPQFEELTRVKVVSPTHPAGLVGLVIAWQERGDSWIYKVSLPDPDKPSETFDNWYFEKDLEGV